ncbi:MAG TPA: helix-turn-helix domain-containing protein [Solirubrobacteraceae bacterium]|nr:helix-turn-helix domain-containing protein [Solirubrobacteraceae bacterium]
MRKRRPRYGGEYGDEEISPRTAAQIQRRAERTERHALAREVEMALSNYRWAYSLSQQDLAERLGISQPQVARLESGVVSPTLDTLMRISGRLDIDFTIEVKSGKLTASATPRRGSRPV